MKKTFEKVKQNEYASSRKTFILSKSTRKDKKFMLDMGDMVHHFGGDGYRDYTLMNLKSSKFYEPNRENRERIKRNYLARHKNDLKGIHSSSTLSDMLLWNKPTLKQSIKDYEKKYNVTIKTI